MEKRVFSLRLCNAFGFEILACENYNQLEISDDLAPMFYETFQDHIEMESSLLQLDNWLNTYREIIDISLWKRKATFKTKLQNRHRRTGDRQQRRATNHENAQQFSNPSSSVTPNTRTTTCPHDTPKNLTTLPILCPPLHGSTHGNTDTSNAVLVSTNSTKVITPPPHENNTVSTPQKSKVNANADFHPAETETQEQPNKNLKGGHKCRSKLVT